MNQYFMQPRGRGLNWGKCFVCGHDPKRATADFASFVKSKEEGEAIIALFAAIGAHARLDYREHEPNWVQVKIMACKQHAEALDFLFDRVNAGDKINAEIIVDALQFAVRH